MSYGLAFDASHWQGDINFNLLKQPVTIGTDIYTPSLLIIKATEGLTETDPKLVSNSAGADGASLFKTYYHFADPSSMPTIIGSAQQQARFFATAIEDLAPCNVPLCIDCETNDENLSPNDYYLWLTTFIDELAEITGHTNFSIYGEQWFLDAYLPPTHTLGKYNLWLCAVGKYENQLVLPVGWSNWSMWQFEQAGTIPAVTNANIDFSFIKTPIA